MKSHRQFCLWDFFIGNKILSAFFLRNLYPIKYKNHIMKKRLQSFGYALRGIRAVIRSEANMQIHLVFTILVIGCGIAFSISLTEWMFCLLCIGLVAGAEMINTAIENIVDLASPEQHPLAGRAKDIAAGAVLVCAIISGVIGLLIFLPKGWHLIAQ
jgi:diacylglycerol kinase (ATP)